MYFSSKAAVQYRTLKAPLVEKRPMRFTENMKISPLVCLIKDNRTDIIFLGEKKIVKNAEENV